MAVGAEAKRTSLPRRTSQAIRTLKDGVIADFEICEKMLRYSSTAHQRRFAKPRMVTCVPSGITGVERRGGHGGGRVRQEAMPAYIIEEPMAAATGAGLPVHEPTGNAVADAGAGT